MMAWVKPDRACARWAFRLGVLVLLASTFSCGSGPDPSLFSEEIRERWIQAFYIPTATMAPTLLAGDRIIVYKGAYRKKRPSRGDVVVFRVSRADNGVFPRDRQPDGEVRMWIQRIAAVPGDVVRIDNGDVFINNRAEPVEQAIGSAEIGPGMVASLHRVTLEDRQFQIAHLSGAKRRSYPEFTVEPDRYFVLGDNRERSYDSREFGTIHESDIVGQAWMIYFSTAPRTLWVRFSRLGRGIR